MKIHPTACVDPKAELSEGVEIGPFAVIGGGVRLGARCVVLGHAQLVGSVVLGDDCEVGHGAVIGGDPQDLGFDRRLPSGVRAGAGNRFREHVTVHRSALEGGHTVLGSGNLLMAGSHLGHDAAIGDGNVLANGSLLGGHVRLGNGAFLGGGTAVHQWVRLGDRCMTQGHAAISQDVPPYVLAAGLNRACGLNVVGMRRAGIAAEVRKEVKEAYRLVYLSKLTLAEALEQCTGRTWSPEAAAFLDFFRTPSRRGICRP